MVDISQFPGLVLCSDPDGNGVPSNLIALGAMTCACSKAGTVQSANASPWPRFPAMPG